jgi:hypothetical protein
MKHLFMGVYQVCANKSPWVKLALQCWGLGGLYTGERPQGHHGPLVGYYEKPIYQFIKKEISTLTTFLFTEHCAI